VLETFHVLAEASTGGSVSTANTVIAILASAVIVVGGLAALVRAIWKTANIVRDNTIATQRLTSQINDLTASVDGRFDQLLRRIEILEKNRSTS